ncbi:hypothetical protein KXD93_12170 [Mucilaginibacter sp. BJC16-A38]|uniref:hypothetical protein n=1 Tax=Mucilaginibacter phenanthrenivorans TaxID=1234842 RepID=UPI002157FE80|nr:hypothetical protein [Mucilaginibacter phenanthrenivorans]MCR8558406.1 hypothetical protein [Mucilaginibacter phenanthrenivorans]
MLKLLPLLFLLIVTGRCFAQEQQRDQHLWRLTIADSATKKGIDKATARINSNQYLMSNSKGEILIDRDLLHNNAQIILSCIGYETTTYALPHNDKFPDTIRLRSSLVSLKEVIIRPAKSITAGIVRKVYKTHRTTEPNEAFVQYIPNKEKIKGTITSVNYVVNDMLHGIEMPFRVRLFLKRKDSITLDKELTTDSIIVYNPEKKHLLCVDVSRYNIQFPENGVLAVFETLSLSYYSKDLTWDAGQQYVKTPGIDMDQTKNYWDMNRNKTDRKTAYSMVGPVADYWNSDSPVDQWYAYADGNNFAITITISVN